MDHGAHFRQARVVGTLVHPPEQRHTVAVVVGRVGVEPLSRPLPDRPDDRHQRLPGVGQCVPDRPAVRGRLAAHQAAALHRPQPL